MKRNRIRQLILMALTLVIGISSRKFGNEIPNALSAYAPDAIWALMVFWTAGFLFTTKPTWWIALFALLFSYTIELTQLYHAPLIDSIRANPVGGLMLGYNF